MDREPISGALPSKDEAIVLDGTFRGKYRGFAAFLICCAILLAAFAVSAVWMQKDGKGLWQFGSSGKEEGETEASREEETTSENLNLENTPESVLPTPIPEGAIPIVSMDLSAPSLGQSYIHNETPYRPDVESLLAQELTLGENHGQPLVLILHTHTSERYLPDGTDYIEGVVGDVAYSKDAKENVLVAGEALSRALNENGITAIHCTVMHDDPTLGGSYSRAEKTIEQYLEIYPTIRLVIDLHRDAVTTAEGTLVRSSSAGGNGAQAMAVVGTDANGTPHPYWQDNLALALQLRERMNREEEGACRPVSLRNASYNQEMARYSLLLEIGTVANSPEEAIAAARAAGKALAELLQSREA